MKKIIAILLIFCLGLLFLWMSPGAGTGDPIRSPIQQAANAAKKGKLKAFMRHVSEDYDDGTYQYDTLKAFLFRRFHSKGGVNVSLGPITVDAPEGENIATVRFVADFYDGFPGSRGSTLEQRLFVLEMRRFEGRWVIQSQANDIP